MARIVNNHTVQVRIPTSLRAEFYEKAEAFGGGGAILRELILAFIDGRVTITPSDAKLQLYKLDKK